jgi:hypothetical protein
LTAQTRTGPEISPARYLLSPPTEPANHEPAALDAPLPSPCTTASFGAPVARLSRSQHASACLPGRPVAFTPYHGLFWGSRRAAFFVSTRSRVPFWTPRCLHPVPRPLLGLPSCGFLCLNTLPRAFLDASGGDVREGTRERVKYLRRHDRSPEKAAVRGEGSRASQRRGQGKFPALSGHWQIQFDLDQIPEPPHLPLPGFPRIRQRPPPMSRIPASSIPLDAGVPRPLPPQSRKSPPCGWAFDHPGRTGPEISSLPSAVSL